MLSDADIQQIIVDEVGDTDDGFLMGTPPNGTSTRIAMYWASFASKGKTYPRLQELYTKRRAAQAVMGQIRRNVGFQTPTLTVSMKEEFAHLEQIVTDTQAEIDRLLKRARSARGAAIGVILTEGPELPPVNWQGPDANDPAYRGDPYRPQMTRPFR